MVFKPLPCPTRWEGLAAAFWIVGLLVVIVGLLVLAVMIGTMMAMYRVWSEFRYDQNGRPVNDGIGHGAPLHEGRWG